MWLRKIISALINLGERNCEYCGDKESAHEFSGTCIKCGCRKFILRGKKK